jgi:hypothetical protein
MMGRLPARVSVVLSVVATALCVVATAHGAGPPLIVVAVEARARSLDEARLRHAIGVELGEEAVAPGDPRADKARGTLTIDAFEGKLVVTYAEHDALLARRVDMPASKDAAVRTVVLLAGNLARDEARDLADELRRTHVTPEGDAPQETGPDAPATPPPGRASGDSHLLGPFEAEAAIKMGYGSGVILPASYYRSAEGPGFGVRFGVSYVGVYAGINAGYYAAIPDATYKQQALEIGIEVGYGFRFGRLTVRPQLGIGNLTVLRDYAAPLNGPAPSSATITSVGTASGTSESHLYLEPGVVVLVSLGSLVYVGGDVSAFLWVVPHVFDSPVPTIAETSVTAHAQVGVKF